MESRHLGGSLIRCQAAAGIVANVQLLPVPMLPIPNWVLIFGIGNILTLATFTPHGTLLNFNRNSNDNRSSMGSVTGGGRATRWEFHFLAGGQDTQDTQDTQDGGKVGLRASERLAG